MATTPILQVKAVFAALDLPLPRRVLRHDTAAGAVEDSTPAA